MTLLNKAVEVARTKEVYNEMYGEFTYEGRKYELHIKEGNARDSVYVYDMETGEAVESFALSMSTYTGD